MESSSRPEPPEVLLSSAALRECSLSNLHEVVASKDCDIQIPVIDMSAPKEDIARQLWSAAQSVGFFTVINHGIPQYDIEKCFNVSTEFFNMPRSKKEEYPFNVELNSGYEYMQQSPPSINTVDQKETMQITARRGCMDNLWPSKPENFRSTIDHMIELTYGVACNILSLLEANACPHLQPGTLVKAHNLNDDGGQCMFRLIHYPPTSGDIIEEDTGLWRCGPHTDWGCLTLLFQRMGEEGLECRVNNNIQEGGDDNAKWMEVKPIEYGITVNIGDMLKRWSDSKLVSNMHRVRMPRIADECKKSRYSIAFFLQANKSALIESETKQHITAGEYFAARIKANY